MKFFRLLGEVQMHPLSQVEAAELQLDRAMSLVLTDSDYVSAVTLACAVESMLGEHLRTRSIEGMTDALKVRLIALTGNTISEKELNDKHINNLRNFLKHARADPNAKEFFGLKHEAITAVTRALGNFALLTERVPQHAEAFYSWVRREVPEMMEAAKDEAL